MLCWPPAGIIFRPWDCLGQSNLFDGIRKGEQSNCTIILIAHNRSTTHSIQNSDFWFKDSIPKDVDVQPPLHFNTFKIGYHAYCIIWYLETSGIIGVSLLGMMRVKLWPQSHTGWWSNCDQLKIWAVITGHCLEKISPALDDTDTELEIYLDLLLFVSSSYKYENTRHDR